MSKTFAFDVYGTLINTHGLVTLLESWIGDQALAFSHTWREKQLEYSFRRGLMKTYQPFSVCTQHALEYTCQYHKVALSAEQKTQLLQGYLSLPAFDDVAATLNHLKVAGHRLFAFSNGETRAVNSLLERAELRTFFDGVISCEDIETFKPSPEVYQYLIDCTGAFNVWLVSSNPFDILGAMASGIQSVWVQRSEEALFDPWGIEPNRIISTLEQLTSD